MMPDVNDYQIKYLIDEFNDCRSESIGKWDGWQYYYIRSTIRYLTRLLFAVGWSKLRDCATSKVNRTMYSLLFKDPMERGGTDSIEPGKFAYTLQTCANELGMYPKVKKELDLLYNLGHVRNNAAHVLNDISFTQFYEDAEKAFEAFQQLMEGKLCSYVIPMEMRGSNKIVCYQLGVDDIKPLKIELPVSSFSWDKQGNRLFYRVLDLNRNTTTFYCLSPFIEIPPYVSRKVRYPLFRVYERVVDNGYGDDCDQLRYDEVAPRTIQEKKTSSGTEMIADIAYTVEEYKRSDLFADHFPHEASRKWIASNTNDVFINLSSYPRFEDIRKNKYKYCREICPSRQDVLTFCLDRNQQVIQITGNGGVGKTALALSILADLFSSRKQYGYSNIMFFSAKKSYYSNWLRPHEIEADICSYGDLVRKIANLLGIDEQDRTDDDIADAIIAKINGSGQWNGRTPQKKFLLIIDDLDSLAVSDQNRIQKFIYQLDAKSLKTILTTRNYAEKSPVCCRLEALQPEQSLSFAKWYTEQKLGIESWTGWSRYRDAKEWVLTNGEGNPLAIQTILGLVNAGMEPAYNGPATQTERSVYLYNTVQNLLTTEEKQIFEICRQLYLGIPESERQQDMLLLVPEYLSAGCAIDKDTFWKSVQKLGKLQLLAVSKNEEEFHPYSRLILTDKVVHIKTSATPGLFRLLQTAVRDNYRNWLKRSYTEDTIADFVINSEGKKEFNTIVARSIMERIMTASNLVKETEQKISDWLDAHSILDGVPGTERLIEHIEETWTRVKSSIDSNLGDTEEDIRELMGSIRTLRSQLNGQPDASITKRLNTVRTEISDYGL